MDALIIVAIAIKLYVHINKGSFIIMGKHTQNCTLIGKGVYGTIGVDQRSVLPMARIFTP